VAYPILARTPGSEPAVASAAETVDELLAQRDAVFQALRELRFDHEVGKITDEDYVAFEASLKQTAANSLRALDEWEAGTDRELDKAIESALASRAAAIAAGAIACSNCGHLASGEDKFCGQCGAILPEAATAAPAVQACPNCGRPFEAADRFCGGCGLELSRHPDAPR
jgi:RNA polymerase subunit RPABC4/transcription elongation factor Spt4